MLLGAPNGTKDILPADVHKWHYLEDKIKRFCKIYGYEEIRTPIFEYTELFKRGIGDTTDIVEKEMYTFIDRGGRSLTLRPENTAAVVRSFIENKLYGDNPLVKVFYMGALFRADKPQAGRYRQFHQFGAEAIGLSGPDVDAEMIIFAVEFLRMLGLKELNLLLNSVGCPVCRPVYREKLQEFIKPNFDKLCHDCKNRFDRNPMRILDCKVPTCQQVIEEAPKLKDFLCEECSEHFEGLKELLTKTDINFVLDDKLVRGLDYYTKTAFEIQYTPLGAQSAVCGGGRYDGLVKECGGDHTPGIGFAMGMERILIALESQGLLPQQDNNADVLLIYAGEGTEIAAFPLVTALRRVDIDACMDFNKRSIKSQLKLANRLGAKSVLILGENELNNNEITFKNMLTSEQTTLALNDVEKIISKITEVAK